MEHERAEAPYDGKGQRYGKGVVYFPPFAGYDQDKQDQAAKNANKRYESSYVHIISIKAYSSRRYTIMYSVAGIVKN